MSYNTTVTGIECSLVWMAKDDTKILGERSWKISNIQLQDYFCKYRVISYGIVWDGVVANMSITDGANLEDMGLGHILTMIALFFRTLKKSQSFY